MSEMFLPAVHKGEWYNEKKIEAPAVTSLYDTRLLGIARLRQLRVRNGVFSTYPGGGYITTLGRTLENSLLIWDFLMEQKWLDPLTRALFIEFTLYNANRNIFNIVNLLVEIDSTGAIHTTEDIKSMNLLVHFEDLGPMILIALILWLLILSLFTLLQLSRIGRISFRLYLRSWWNVIDLVILAMAVAIIALYLLRSRYVSALVKQLQEADQNEFVNFIWASFWQEQLRYFIAALVCVSTARLWKLLRFQQQFRAFEHVLVHASKTLVFLTCMMVVIVIGFAIFAHMYIGHTNELFSNFLFAFSAMVMYGIGYSEVNVEEFVKQDAFIGSVFVGTFWMVYIIYLLNIFITVINILYEKNKKEEGFFQADYTMLDYLREEIRYMCKRRRHSPKSIRRATVKEMYPQYFEDGNETKEERLRAGADTRAKPVHCAPAIAVPKPDEIRNENSQEITAFRLKGMTFLAVGAIRKQDKKVDAMTALVLDCALDEKGEEAFYSGLDEEKEKLVPNEKLLQMESVVNKIGAEQYAAHTMKEYEDIENREDEIEDEITSLDDVGHLDVLKCQMIKILKIISDWDTPDKSKRQRKIKKRKKRDESENEEESLKKADQGNVLPDLASNGRMEPISADAKQSEEAAPLGVAALPVVVPPSVSDRNIYKTDFCGLFPLKIDLSANGQESSHAAFSMTQATHDPFRPSANQITTLRRTCRRPARVSEDRTAVRTVPPYLDDYSASDTNQSSQNGTASFQRQPCTHRRRNITPERRDPNRNPNQDNSLPPDFCARCSFLKLSDDEKLLLMQQQQQQFGTNVSQPVSREQTTDIEQVRRVLFMLLNSYLYPHEPLSSLCWRCQRPTGLRDMDHDRRARQQDVRSYENFGMVQNRSFENQYPVSNRTGIDKLTHVATDTLQNTRTGKQGVYHRVFPVHHVSRRPPTLHGKCLWRRRDERHMRQFFAAPRASNQFYSSDWQHLAPQEQEVSGSQNDPSLQIDFHIHSYRGRNETRLSQRGCRQRRFRRL
ncbi:hypothetical protein C0J52_19081 [Blattella germanica]|nr:hypothetical protein C0J52_19081 [Blattella germanica]